MWIIPPLADCRWSSSSICQLKGSLNKSFWSSEPWTMVVKIEKEINFAFKHS